jgi:hypothetical protein
MSDLQSLVLQPLLQGVSGQRRGYMKALRHITFPLLQL